jgi:hypothetical protein
METLGIIILIFFLAIGVLVGGLVGNYKKTNLPKIPVTEECSEGICPVPKNWKGDKK